MWYLWCVNDHGAETANQCLERFLDAEQVPVINTLWVLGIEVAEVINLSGGLLIQPAENLPLSGDREVFLQQRLDHTITRVPTPSAAITKRCMVNKVRSANQSSEEDGSELEGFFRDSARLHDAALVLNALDDVSCLPYYSTSYPDELTPLGLIGGAGGGASMYDVWGWTHRPLASDSKRQIDSLLRSFVRLGSSEQSRIRRVLGRLSQAKRRSQIEDKILDLGIAAEMLLLDDNKNADQLALSFRLRGSWLLAQSKTERLDIYNMLRRLYMYRSQVAHGGVLCKGDSRKIDAVRRSFNDYQAIVERICRRIIRKGRPDWNRLVLGAKVR